MTRRLTDREIVDLTAEASVAWGSLDLRLFAPDDESSDPPLPDKVASALLVAAMLQSPTGKMPVESIEGILGEISSCYAKLSVLRAVLIGLVGIGWDAQRQTITIHRIVEAAEVRRRRDLLTTLLKAEALRGADAEGEALLEGR